MRISVYGTGYLGAVHAAGLAAMGHEVVGMDVDPMRIGPLERGEAPFFEPGLPELLSRGVESGRLRFTTSIDTAVEFGDVHFVCVGTPQLRDGNGADLRYVEAVVRDIAERLDRSVLVVGKSTVPVGTARQLAGLLHDHARPGLGARLAWNPEFLREGFAVEDTLRPDRLVFGVEDSPSEEILRDLYRPVLQTGVPCYVTDLETSELVKVAANSFLAMKISFINAMAEVCEQVDGDVVTLADAIGEDARIGRRFLNAGVGFGGGCLGKDIRAFQARGAELGLADSLAFLAEADRVNDRRRDRVVDLASSLLGELAGRRITVLGASFKPDSDDVRDSPALAVARRLHAAGAQVVVHDPESISNARQAAPELSYEHDVEVAARGADLVVHLTEWRQYGALDPRELGEVVSQRLLIDGRNALDRDAWSAAGWTCHSLGRPSVGPWAGVTSAVPFPLSAAADSNKEEVA
ncbi:UDP-glucose dehydrogenase family protein [Amnibacterium endophyticum]|uniref:UDP-glucose 6-dehydrogenase n=1 Tax=Amnibacterium endophyticum TaxID=2109337 RepID=A0ABW4LC53_9MICO